MQWENFTKENFSFFVSFELILIRIFKSPKFLIIDNLDSPKFSIIRKSRSFDSTKVWIRRKFWFAILHSPESTIIKIFDSKSTQITCSKISNFDITSTLMKNPKLHLSLQLPSKIMVYLENHLVPLSMVNFLVKVLVQLAHHWKKNHSPTMISIVSIIILDALMGHPLY